MRRKERAAELARLIQRWMKGDNRRSIRTLASRSEVSKVTVEKARLGKVVTLEPTLKILLEIADIGTSLKFVRSYMPTLKKFVDLRDKYLLEKKGEVTSEQVDAAPDSYENFAAEFELPDDVSTHIFVRGKTLSHHAKKRPQILESLLMVFAMLLLTRAEQYFAMIFTSEVMQLDLIY